MSIKLKYAAVAAVTFVAPFFGQAAHAMGPSPLGNPPSFNPGSQMQIPGPGAQPPVMPQRPQMPQMPQMPQRPQLPPQMPAFGPQAQPPAQAPAQAPASKQSQPAAKPKAATTSNTYIKGQCTWYAKEKRPDLPNGLGNGGQWVANAAKRGFSTGTTAKAGAIGEQTGHVVYIESVSGSKVNISEMNYAGKAGVVHKRTVSVSTFKYIY